jgi:transcriptional regulator GlxA family with amidase domain
MRSNNHYHERVNRVLDYIGEHLDGELSLAGLSQVGCFSPFHFHRIFQAVTGETLNLHVRRVRLERAALLMKTSPRKRITDVAIETGFAGNAEILPRLLESWKAAANVQVRAGRMSAFRYVYAGGRLPRAYRIVGGYEDRHPGCGRHRHVAGRPGCYAV